MITRDDLQDYVLFVGILTWAVIGILMLYFNLTNPDIQEWFFAETGIKLWTIF